MDRRFVIAGLLGASGAAMVATRLVPGGNGGPLSGGPDASVARALPGVVSEAPAPFGKVICTPVPLGAGGFVTGIDISPDGSRFVCRTDVCNAYVRNKGDTAWSPLFSPATMRTEDYDPLPEQNGKADGRGCAGVRMAPSDKNVIYAAYLGYIWKSSDGGKTIARTKLPQKAMPANSGWQRLFNPTIDVHPTDPGRVIVGTWAEGVWYTLDGGVKWVQAKLPATAPSLDNQPGMNLVLFDPASPDTIYVFVTGVGLHLSTTGLAGEFQLIAGSPRYCANLVAGPKGTVLVAENNGNRGASLWSYAPAAGWTSSRPPREIHTLTVNPRDPAHFVAYNGDGFVLVSRDGGKGWTQHEFGWSQAGSEIAWIGQLKMMFPAEIRFDPNDPDAVWVAHGVGVMKATNLDGKWRYVDWSVGIEELPAVGGLSVPGGKMFMTAWDKSIWRLDDETRFTNTLRYPRARSSDIGMDMVAQGTYLDYAPEEPRFMVGVAGPPSAPGYSPDGGDNWYFFEGTPPRGWGYGGCIAAGSKSNIVLLPSNNGFGAYTHDGGKSWETIKLDGVNETAGFANAYYVTRKNLAADKARPGIFALVYTTINDNAYNNPLGGLWLTRDGGRSWNRQCKGVVGNPGILSRGGQDARQFWQCKLDFVPGANGELVYTPHADGGDDRLWWSKDDGATWQEINAAIRNVISFGFGKPAPGQSRPVLFFWGTVKGVQGLYASVDWGATPPVLLTRFPSQHLAGIIWVEGDANRFGRAYVGTGGAGWVSVQFNG